MFCSSENGNGRTLAMEVEKIPKNFQKKLNTWIFQFSMYRRKQEEKWEIAAAIRWARWAAIAWSTYIWPTIVEPAFGVEWNAIAWTNPIWDSCVERTPQKMYDLRFVFRILVGWVVINGPWCAGSCLVLSFFFLHWRRLIRRRCARQCKSKMHYNDAKARNSDDRFRIVRSRRQNQQNNRIHLFFIAAEFRIVSDEITNV